VSRSELFDPERVSLRLMGKPERAEDAPDLAGASDNLEALGSPYFQRLRKQVDEEMLRILDELTTPDGVALGQMKALRKIGRQMDADVAESRRKLDV
jgi:hypothetical protein